MEFGQCVHNILHRKCSKNTYIVNLSHFDNVKNVFGKFITLTFGELLVIGELFDLWFSFLFIFFYFLGKDMNYFQ